MIRTFAAAAALAGAILFPPVAQAQPDGSTGNQSNSPANGATFSRGPNRFVPAITATPFGAPGTIADQPGLAIAATNGNLVVPTGTPFGAATPMANGNMVVPATTTTPLTGGVRTRHANPGPTTFAVLARLFG